MKNLIILSILLFVVSSCQKEDFEIINLNNNKITVLGHGGMGIGETYPMNSFESILNCLNLGADGTEIDVQMTKDGVLVAFHDESLEHSTNISGRIFNKTWDEIKAAFRNIDFTVRPAGDITEKVLRGWLGQIAGGAYGTALEGYTGSNLQKTYGNKLNWYVREPETLNDDITFEIAFLKAAEKKGKNISSVDIADMWLQFIPFGWSAEYFALENLNLLQSQQFITSLMYVGVSIMLGLAAVYLGFWIVK